MDYEMTQSDLEKILEACKPVRYMVIGGIAPSSPPGERKPGVARVGRANGV